MQSSVRVASSGGDSARRLKSVSSAGKVRTGRRVRRAAIKARISELFFTRSSPCFSPKGILVEIPRRRCERSEQTTVVVKPARDQMDHVAVALDQALDAEQARAEQLCT